MRARRGAVGWALAWLLSAALYLVLIDITDLPELIAGAVVVTIAAIAFELVREQHIADVATRLSWLSRLYVPALRVPLDVFHLSVAAVDQLIRPRRVRGGFRAVRFGDSGGSELAAGRHALAEAFGSFAPNTIIVGVDRERRALLAHQLRTGGGPEAVDPLGLG